MYGVSGRATPLQTTKTRMCDKGTPTERGWGKSTQSKTAHAVP